MGRKLRKRIGEGDKRKMNMMNFIIFNLVIYLPFHLFEEAIGDFPKWMYEHKWLPYHMTHGHWMANGTLFLINSVLGLRNYILSNYFSVPQLVVGILIGGILFGLPMGLCIVLYKFFDKYFK